jgi:hypothetical protein
VHLGGIILPPATKGAPRLQRSKMDLRSCPHEKQPSALPL